jgi:hypothetical protein
VGPGRRYPGSTTHGIPLTRILVQGIGPHVCHGAYSKFVNEVPDAYHLGRECGCLAACRDALRKGVSTMIAEGAFTDWAASARFEHFKLICAGLLKRMSDTVEGGHHFWRRSARSARQPPQGLQGSRIEADTRHMPTGATLNSSPRESKLTSVELAQGLSMVSRKVSSLETNRLGCACRPWRGRPWRPAHRIGLGCQ